MEGSWYIRAGHSIPVLMTRDQFPSLLAALFCPLARHLIHIGALHPGVRHPVGT